MFSLMAASEHLVCQFFHLSPSKYIAINLYNTIKKS
nr:MAG TPA: Transcriptional adapter [Crassvirales sp.]